MALNQHFDAIMALSPLFYLRCADASGGAVDATSNARNFTAGGTPVYAQASLLHTSKNDAATNKRIQLTASGYFSRAATASVINSQIPTGVTVGAVFSASSLTNYAPFFDSSNGGATGFRLWMTNNGLGAVNNVMLLEVWDDAGTRFWQEYTDTQTSPFWKDGTAVGHELAVRLCLNNTTKIKVLDVLVDGVVLVPTNTSITGTPTTFAATHLTDTFYVGSYSGLNAFYTGFVDDIWAVAGLVSDATLYDSILTSACCAVVYKGVDLGLALGIGSGMIWNPDSDGSYANGSGAASVADAAGYGNTGSNASANTSTPTWYTDTLGRKCITFASLNQAAGSADPGSYLRTLAIAAGSNFIPRRMGNFELFAHTNTSTLHVTFEQHTQLAGTSNSLSLITARDQPELLINSVEIQPSDPCFTKVNCQPSIHCMGFSTGSDGRVGGPETISISSLTPSTGVVTAVCAAAHDLATGDFVTISGATVPTSTNANGYNGRYPIVVIDTVTFTYLSPETGAAGGTIIVTPDPTETLLFSDDAITPASRTIRTGSWDNPVSGGTFGCQGTYNGACGELYLNVVTSCPIPPRAYERAYRRAMDAALMNVQDVTLIDVGDSILAGQQNADPISNRNWVTWTSAAFQARIVHRNFSVGGFRVRDQVFRGLRNAGVLRCGAGNRLVKRCNVFLIELITNDAINAVADDNSWAATYPWFLRLRAAIKASCSDAKIVVVLPPTTYTTSPTLLAAARAWFAANPWYYDLLGTAPSTFNWVHPIGEAEEAIWGAYLEGLLNGTVAATVVGTGNTAGVSLLPTPSSGSTGAGILGRSRSR